MIKLSELVVMVAHHDGTVMEFEAEQFQTEIIRSFLAAENSELWVAEDIVMAVEYALLAHDCDEKIFSLIEIETIITGILEDAGFAEVAECYRRGHRQRNITFSPERNYLLQLLTRHVGLTGKTLEAVIDKVIMAGTKLQIDAAAPELFVALAKYYKSQLLTKNSPTLDQLALPTATQRLSRIKVEKITEYLDNSSIYYLDNNIIKLYSISSLFPTVRIAINLTKLASNSQLTPPITELSLFDEFSNTATAINDIVNAADIVFARSGKATERELPLDIAVPDMAEFAEQWLEASWPACRPCCRDMMGLLEAMLERKPFKLTIA